MWTKLLGHIITIASDSGLLSVAFLLSSRNSQNIGHANMKGFTVYVEVVMFCSGGQCNVEEPLREPWPCEELLTAS